MTIAITTRQAEVLRFIEATIAARGYAPTLADICARFRIASVNGAREHLDALVRKGYIERAHRKSRAIRVLRRAPVARVGALATPRDAVGKGDPMQTSTGGVALYWQIKTSEAAVCAA